MTNDRIWQVTWETGPDAGECWYPTAGRHVVGRAPQADLRCDDPALQPFHAQLDLDGELPVVVQLAGRLPVRVDGDGPWRVRVGNSVLLLLHRDRQRPTSHGTSHATGQAVVRVPRHLATWSPDPVRANALPAAPVAPSGGLVPAIAGAVTTVVMAVVVRQMMFVVFGVMGTVIALSTWVAGRLAHRKRTRRHHQAQAVEHARLSVALAAQQRAWADHVRHAVPTLHDAIDAGHTSDVWQRRAGDDDATTVSLGIGSIAWTPVADDTVVDRSLAASPTVDDLPVGFDLVAGARLAISGPHAVALANALVLQLATLTGPADWQLVVVTADPESWQWTRHLPHARDAAARHLLVDEAGLLELVRDGALTGRHTVLVTDLAAILTVRTSALRRLESAHDSLALVVVHHGPTPAVCRSSVVTMSDGRARHVTEVVADPEPVVFRLSGAAPASAERWARQLRDRRDPEDERLNGLDIPATVGITALLNEVGVDLADATSIAAAWTRAGNDPAPRAPIGRARDGVVEIDLVRDGPHALLAGTTGAGKSELLRSLVVGLSCVLSPEHLTFVLVDYKGGAAFDELAGLPHVVGMVTDLDHQLAERALRSLQAELTMREQVLRDHGATDLTVLRTLMGAPVLPRVLVVVDEFAALATEQAEFLHALVGIAQRGRSLGVHLLLATQRPSGVISDDIRANTNLRVALRLHDTADAIDVVGDALPATLPRTVPGRAVMRLGPDELVTFQTAHTTGIGAIVETIRAAAEGAHLPRPRSVWCEPLPERIEQSDLAGLVGADRAAIGVIDLPDQQSRAPFDWKPGDGSVLVVGSFGSGVTSTLITMATTALDERTDLFVIDAGNDPHWDAVATHPRCAAVVRLHERERLWRVLDQLAADATNRPRRLVIDGLAALRLDLDGIGRADELDLFERVVTTGDATLLIGADRLAAMPPSVVSRCVVRVVLHTADVHDASSLGVRATSVPPAVAGRAFVAGVGAVQFVAPRVLRSMIRTRSRAGLIEALPSLLRADQLPAATHDDVGWRAPVGLGFRSLAPVALDVVDGEHVLIAGPARSGRSTALAHVATAWLASHAAASVVVIAGRRSPLARWLQGQVAHHDRFDTALDDVDALLAAGRRVMLVIDDAELVDDPTGRLTAMIVQRTARLLVVAGARPDALRQTYGHWTAAVRRSRLGLLAAGSQEIEADLLGATLPRRALLAPRPGLFHVIDGGTTQLAQIAVPQVSTIGAAERAS
jgi:S-DNA-T family DNA segregation ATPase FtsK/SpoIIIE